LYPSENKEIDVTQTVANESSVVENPRIRNSCCSDGELQIDLFRGILVYQTRELGKKLIKLFDSGTSNYSIVAEVKANEILAGLEVQSIRGTIGFVIMAQFDTNNGRRCRNWLYRSTSKSLRKLSEYACSVLPFPSSSPNLSYLYDDGSFLVREREQLSLLTANGEVTWAWDGDS
jgi:hypothetical protein